MADHKHSCASERASAITLETGGCLVAGMHLFCLGGGKYFMTCFRLRGLEGEVIAALM